MSPYYILIDAQPPYSLCAKVRNRDSELANIRDIKIYNVGQQVKGNSLPSASIAPLLVGTYRCAKAVTGYRLTRTTCGRFELVSRGIQSLKECQMLALSDYCKENNLTPKLEAVESTNQVR